MYSVLLFYKYTHIADVQAVYASHKTLCETLGITGRIILATEGINGTVCGLPEQMAAYKMHMNADDLFSGIDFKESSVTQPAFERLSIYIKREITVLGIDPTDLPASEAAEYITPEELHTALQNSLDNLLLFDARNAYESRIGAFQGAVCAPINTFRELPAYLRAHAELFADKDVIMYCTGGIRCERSSALMKRLTRARSVRHLHGGIHRYAELYPQGYFKGRNYVFDNRISVKVTDDLLAECTWCTQPCARYLNCLNAHCNAHVIVCTPCQESHLHTCSTSCKEGIRSHTVPQRPRMNTYQEDA